MEDPFSADAPIYETLPNIFSLPVPQLAPVTVATPLLPPEQEFDSLAIVLQDPLPPAPPSQEILTNDHTKIVSVRELFLE